jgi:F-type H+-transporting ATPase subunit b
MITFALFVWFTMRFVWPPVIKALHERQARIAEGLAAADRGHRDLELAQESVKKHLKDAKAQCHDLIEAAKKQAQHVLDLAKTHAKEQTDRQMLQAESEIEVLVQQAKESLRTEVADLAML